MSAAGAAASGAQAVLAAASFWDLPGLMTVLAALNRDGAEARVVGGAVRNALLDLPIHDVDIATDALPDEVIRRAAAAGIKAVPTGVDHGTVTLVAEGRPYEVTTLREDVETDGRRAVVRFGRNWRHDAERRDFTVNALYATADRRLVDLVGGVADLALRRVRFIGAPEARIREDYLRILRLFRFHAAYGAGPLDGPALSAAIRLREGLSGLSRERVRAEMMKLLMAPGVVATVAAMSDCGILQPILGGLADLSGFARLVALERDLAHPRSAVRRLGALAVRVREDAERLAERLRLSNAEAARLSALAGPVPAGLDEKGRRAFIYRIGAEAALDRALIARARGGGAEAEALAHLAGTWQVPAFPVRAQDMMARGYRPGPALGAALARARDAWIAADFPDEPSVIAALCDAAAAGGAPGGG